MIHGGPSPAPKRTYDAFLQDIESGLRSGRIKTGDQLPGERILAETYSISRASVREAMRILDVMGILRSPTGAGPKSGALVVSEPSAGVSSVLRLHVASSRLPVSEIVETRILLESWAARTACAQENPAGLDRARELLAAMDKSDIDPESFHALDAQFHLALSALAGNTVIETIMESLSGSIRDYIKDSLASLGQWPAVLITLREQPHSIFGAIEARDGEKAENLLREHVAWLYERTKDPNRPGASSNGGVEFAERTSCIRSGRIGSRTSAAGKDRGRFPVMDYRGPAVILSVILRSP